MKLRGNLRRPSGMWPRFCPPNTGSSAGRLPGKQQKGAQGDSSHMLNFFTAEGYWLFIKPFSAIGTVSASASVSQYALAIRTAVKYCKKDNCRHHCKRRNHNQPKLLQQASQQNQQNPQHNQSPPMIPTCFLLIFFILISPCTLIYFLNVLF